MPRPVSARTRPLNTHKTAGSTRSADVSYEDLLVAQYLEELKKSPAKNKTGTQMSQPSPYSQRLSTHTHIMPAPGMRRPQSAKPKVDSKFIADPDLWDPATPRQSSTKRTKSRPASAPVYKTRIRKRPLSATYGGSTPTTAKYGSKKIKPLYKKQPMTIVVTAFRNGCRDEFARVAAPNIKMLLELCTEKLSMPNAARRIFMEDGTEIYTANEIIRDSDVYISMGETFKNPYKGVKKQSSMSKNSQWTMNGVVWDQDTKKTKTKPVLSKRFRTLIEQSRRRVLVFKNGSGAEGVEIVADPSRFEEFLTACTAKLDMRSYARVLYDWEGQEIYHLDDAPVLDQCLQTWSTPVLGPLWVSSGSGFSPKGVNEFLSGLINYTKAKLREAKHYQRQLRYAQDEEKRDQVEIVAILSMCDHEIEETLDIVAKDIEDFSNALNRLKAQQKKIEKQYNREQEEGYSYTLKHINEKRSADKLIGTKGLRLKVFENGTSDNDTTIYINRQMAGRGLENDKDRHEKTMSRILDQCAENSNLTNPKQNPAIGALPRKLFDEKGNEITNPDNLEYDQEVWLSFGEPWKNPFTYVLGCQFDKVSAIDFETEEGDKRRAIREQLSTEDVQDVKSWDAVVGIPDNFEVSRIERDADAMQMDHINAVIETAEINPNSHFLRAKKKSQMLLYPEVVVDTKKEGGKGSWPPEAQMFVISKNGYIYSKAFPQLVLSVAEQKITIKLQSRGQSPRDTTGFVVTLQKKGSGGEQQWVFTEDGFVCSQSQPELALTYLGGAGDEEENVMENQEEDVLSGERFFIAVFEKLEGKQAKNQRWAIKQEKAGKMGQWKHTQVENPEWNKKALSWPAKEDGSLNEDYDWPMEGYLIPHAPPIKNPDKKKQANQAKPPLRLLVMKNGVRDVSNAVAVVGPDLTNMKKDLHQKDGKGKKNKKKIVKQEDKDHDDVAPAEEDLSVLKLEFILFLERCTTMLGLPFAARRLFNAEGKEYFSLVDLERDQLMYVSCGESWSDPTVSKAEQQRRYLLASLNSDVSQIMQYVAIRNPDDLVVEVEAIAPGARVMVNNSAAEKQDTSRTSTQKVVTYKEPEDCGEQEAEPDLENKMDALNGELTAHEMAHIRSEERMNLLKWPWEREGNEGLDAVAEANEEEQHFTDKELYRKYRPKQKRRDNLSLQQQKLVLEDGYIALRACADLVLGMHESEGRVAEVVLVKRRPDDIHQRWILQENGIIQSKHNPQMVLTVTMPTGLRSEEDDEMFDANPYIGSQVVLQNRKSSQFGQANQKWYYDEATGFISAFHTDVNDKEITGANKANICTYAVMGGTEVDQPGYVAEVQTGKTTKKLLVCSSCARSMRGRFKLEKVQANIDFACAMGSPKSLKQLGIKQIGSFQCLNGKVDLSTHEAQHTLDEWEDQLAALRDEVSVRAIARQISAARAPYTVKVLAYKNGDGRLKPGELIVGSSVPGILQQSSSRLELTRAPQRLYTSDGLIILNLDDLVDWAREQHVKEAQKQLKAEKRAQRLAAKQKQPAGKDEKKLMDKVELDSSETEEEEEEIWVEEQKTENLQTAKPHVEQAEFSLGYAADPERRNVDVYPNCVILPNSGEGASKDGCIISWHLHAMRRGEIYLQVFRASQEDQTAFSLVAQNKFTIGKVGLHKFDSKIEIRRGDMIGFYVPGDPIIAYDVEESTNQPSYYMKPKAKPELGQMLKMEPFVQVGMRKYSLSCRIIETHKSEPVEKPPSGVATKTVKKKKKEKTEPYIEPPPVDLVLRYPIEVWVSAGETFVMPEKVEEKVEKEVQQREERAAVSYELEKEKHILRQMQGRRYGEQDPGDYRTTRNPQHPVYKQGHWQDARVEELQKHDIVHKLQTHLHEVKTQQRNKALQTCNVKTTKRLYSQPAMKRVLVFPNGETLERAVYVWGETLTQVVDTSTMRLNLRKPAKHIFTIDGTLVTNFDDIERDQLLCVAPNKTFLKPKESQQLIQVKANWGRARKQYGPAATDIVVVSQRNPEVDVDPFGPSPITESRSIPKSETQSSARSYQSPASVRT